MPNYIQYSTSIPSGSLKKGNAALGITDSVAGPTSNTGWYTGINPPTGSYTVYEVAASGDPDIYCPINSTELINLVKSKGATGGNTGSVAAALAWIATQNNLLATNEVYPNIVTSGSVIMLDAGFVGSYPTTSSIWYDISGNNNNGSLINSPTFDSVGAIVLDGVDDYITAPSSSILNTLTAFTYTALLNISSSDTYGSIIARNTSLVWYAGRSSVTQRLFIGGNSTGDSNTFLPSNKYTYICVTWDGTTIRYYFNGVPDGTATNTSSAFNTTPISIGRFQTGEYFQGKINNVGIYNRALSQTEILQNYYQAPIVTNGLVLAVDAGNIVSYESGSTIAYSLTGSISGSLVNGTAYSVDNGGSWLFDNTDDYIALPNDLGYSTTTLSVFSWFKSNGSPSGNYHIICGGQQLEISIPWPGGALRTGIQTDTRYVSNHGSGLNDGKWHYIGFTFDGVTKTSYIDEINVGTQTITSGTLVTSFSSRFLGRFGSSAVYYANGNMGGYWIYNKVLTAAEVSQNYNAQKSRFGF